MIYRHMHHVATQKIKVSVEHMSICVNKKTTMFKKVTKQRMYTTHKWVLYKCHTDKPTNINMCVVCESWSTINMTESETYICWIK